MPWSLRKAIRIKGRLSDAQIDHLLDRLDFNSLCHERLLVSRRKETRYSYRLRGISIGLTQDGQDVTLVISGRNLSSTGLAFLHVGPIPLGTTCQVRLVEARGQDRVLTGIVAHCRAVQQDVHEVGVRFDQPIDPQPFVGGKNHSG
jgi:hypothetical protein